MRPSICFASLASTVVAGFCLVALTVMVPDFARANESGPKAQNAPCHCPETQRSPPANPWARPKVADLKATPTVQLDENDEIAALDAIRHALVEVADGSAYVWHRYHGRLSGVIQPTASFKDAAGNVCRHIITLLTTGQSSRQVEGIACRLPDGNWQLDG